MPFFQKRSDRGKGRGGGGAYQGQGGRGGGRGGWAPGAGAEGGGISRSRPRGPSPEDEELERSLGFGTFTEGDTRLGWLMNMSPVRNRGHHDTGTKLEFIWGRPISHHSKLGRSLLIILSC